MMILTLAFDSASFAILEQARQRHFPPARNFIPAHLTLFQQLPEPSAPALARYLNCIAARTPPLGFALARVLDFGGGAAFGLDMPGHDALHDRLRRGWRRHITASDDRRRTPHVTVQNKVARDVALATLDALRRDFAPWPGTADRLLLWHYRGGPWEAAGAFPLTGPAVAPDTPME